MTARIKRSLPSTMSSAPILSNFTCKHYKTIESTKSPLNSKRVLKYNCENKIKQLIRVKEITPKLKRLDFKTILFLILPVNTIRNAWRTVLRICILILVKYEVLSCSSG